MLRWIWEHVFWPPRSDIKVMSRRSVLEELLEVRTRVGALELDLAKLRGRIVGGLRTDPDPDPDPELELDDLGEVIDDSRALGARRRFGKES